MSDRRELWFDWPPELLGEDDEMESWWQRNEISLVGGIALMLGLFGLLMTHFNSEFMGDWRRVADGIAVGFATAGVLAITVDRLLGQRALTNVFKYAVGHILPAELVPSMRWIYNQRIICVKHWQLCELTENPADSETLVMQVTMRRTYENVGSAESRKFGVGIDEWFQGGKDSTILEYGYSIGGVDHGISDLIWDEYRLRVKPQDVTLPAGEHLQEWCTYEQMVRPHDALYMFHGIATVKPEVIVRAPEGITIRPRFHTGQGDSDLKPQGAGQYEYPGTLLPMQAIVIRWWRDKDARDRLERLKTERGCCN